jgi:hypothetical protein
MTKRILTLALGVAVIAVLMAPAVFASNMGFKLERQLTNLANSRNLYIVSLPFFRSYEDLGSFAGAGAPPGPPDGMVTAVDVLMDWFTNGDGSCDGGWECDGEITLQNFEADPALNSEQLPTDLTISFSQLTQEMSLIGTDYPVGHDTAPGRADEKPRGYTSIIAAGDFPSITVGSHDPEWGNGTWAIQQFAGSRNLHFYGLPYHTTFTTASELLTAAYNVVEDTEEITLQTFDPDPNSNDQQLFTDCTVRPNFPPDGTPNFQACSDFPLVPGQGYNLIVAAAGADGQVDVPLTHY